MVLIREYLNIPKNNNQYVVIGRKNCGYTQNAYSILYNRKLNFYYYDYHNDLNKEQKEQIDRYCGSHRTFPRVFYNDKLVGGYTELQRFLN